MAFRKYGGLNYAATNNIIRNHYANSDNFSVSNFIGQYNSKIVSESHYDMSGNSLLNVEAIYFMDGSSLVGGTENGNFTINGNLTVTGTSTLQGTVITGTNAIIETDLFVTGTSTLTGQVTTVANAIIGTDLTVKEKSNLNGLVTIGTSSTTNPNLTVIGESILQGLVTIGTSGATGATGTNLMVYGATQSTSFYASSDYRIKENIESLHESITVDQLKPISYTHKETNQKNIGFLAHEVQEVFPFLVEGTKDGPETQSLNYIGLIGVLTKEIQDLKNRVKKLEIK